MQSKEGFGTFSGIFIPNVTMMFGVILFLRLGVIVGNVGPWQFSGIVLLAMTLMIITSLSIAMIATNMEIGKGGVYYLISRSLGIEIGSAIGIAITLSQLACLALCTSAFAYSLTLLYPTISVSLVEGITLVAITMVSILSVNLAIKMQIAIFLILIVSTGSLFFGSMDGAVNISGSPEFMEGSLSFWKAFALFYPAMTGIEAGMAMSGNLRNPSRSLSVGNIYSILLVGFSYLAVGLFLYFNIPENLLKAYPFLIIDFSPFSWLIYTGIWAAAIASALGCLVGAPRMLQSLAQDGVLPEFLGHGHGKNSEPRWAIGVTFLAGLALMLFTTIDQIIPVLSMICLISYGTLNLVAGIAQLINSPSWRPTFSVPWYIPMSGFCCAIFFMFMIDAGWTFIALGLTTSIYLIMRARKLKVSFPDFRDSLVFFFSRLAIYRLASAIEHPLNWHPQILACTGAPGQQLPMLFLASSLTRRSGIMTTASVVPETWEDPFQKERTKNSILEFLSKQGILSLVEVCPSQDSYQGIEALIRNYGIGPLQPNTILIGLPERAETQQGLLQMMRTVSLSKKNLMLFQHRNEQEALDLFLNKSKDKLLEIWWDSSNGQSFELTLSFVSSLTANFNWQHAKIKLNAVASDEKAKFHIQEYLAGYMQKSRINICINVIISSEQNALSLLSEHSEGDLCFFPLLPLGLWPAEEQEKALAYLNEVYEKVPKNKAFVLLTCYDNIEHRKIYG